MSFENIGAELTALENAILQHIGNELSGAHALLPAAACDAIFGVYTHQYLLPCLKIGLASRAAWFSTHRLVPAVVHIEHAQGIQFHKGALFYDTSVAHFVAGNQDAHEYFLAMTDEEEFRKTGGQFPRGNFNLQNGGLAAQTISDRLQFASAILNGYIHGSASNYTFITGAAPIVAAQFDAWRLTLDALHQFELFRIVNDLHVFVGSEHLQYPAVSDNPFVLLRLAKALSHLAQWVESCLTQWQGGGHGTLSTKLTQDPDFGAAMIASAGNQHNFAGNNPHDGAIGLELQQLLVDLKAAPIGAERSWRTLRILYIVRNATAHAIKPNIGIYQDRGLLLELVQVVFVSVFVVCQLKARPMP